jgi:hypothetical protein
MSRLILADTSLLATTVAHFVVAAAVTPFDPSKISGLKLWLCGDDATLSGSKVSTWVDQSGNGHDFTQPTVNVQPGMSTAINGQPCVHFNASYLIGPKTFMTGAKTIVIVRNFTAAGWGLQFTTGGSISTLSYGHFDSAYRFQCDYSGFGSPTTMNNGQGLTGSHIDYVDYNGGDVTLASSYHSYLDGALQTLGVPDTFGGVDYGSASCVGGQIFSGGFFNGITGDIAEILEYSNVLSAADRNNLGGYFQTRYGITIAGATF